MACAIFLVLIGLNNLRLLKSSDNSKRLGYDDYSLERIELKKNEFDRISKDLGLKTPVDTQKDKFLILFFLDEKPCARCINEMFEYIEAIDSIDVCIQKI